MPETGLTAIWQNRIQIEMKVVIEEPLSEAAKNTHFDEVYIRDKALITVGVARKFLQINSVSKLTLWCGISRAAMQHIISLPKLNELVVFELARSGRLSGFADARSLTQFSCVVGGLTETDLLEITKCKSLERLGAQQSVITETSLEAILTLPALSTLDLEASNFNDHHARLVAQSKTIKKLDVGATRLSKSGLQHLCAMKQLTDLDIWSNNIEAEDLDLLSELPNLEYLSIGGHDEQTTFTAENTIPKLEKIPSLKRLWLDGLKLSDDERKYLEKRYEKIR